MNSSKSLLHKELQLSYREFFESTLAKALLLQPELFPSVKKISAAIVELILADKNKVIAIINDDPKIIPELKEPYFGACYEHAKHINPATACEKILAVLTSENYPLQNIMQIHCIFIQRIAGHLACNNNKENLVKLIFPATLFNAEERCREKALATDFHTTQLGISNHPVFNKMLGQSSSYHLRAKNRFNVKPTANFFKVVDSINLPFVCGPSGHTGSLILGAHLYGNLTRAELKEYIYAIFAFLVSGGNHSHYEIMIVAKQIIEELEPDDYARNIPQAIQETDMFKKLSRQFPEFLSIEGLSKSLCL